MKTLVLNIWLILSVVTPLFAKNGPEAYFCTKKGATLMYERRTPSSGKLWWRHTVCIDDVKQRADGTWDVVFSTLLQSEQVKSPVEGLVLSAATILNSGDVQIDIAATAANVVKEMFKVLKFKYEGGMSTLRALATPGDSLQEIHATISWSVFRYTIDYIERSVLRHETISVPAGTFHCIVVRERKIERRPFFKNDRITLTWYALGYGLVRHDTYFPDGELESSEQLVYISV